ncbi:MAG: peptide MFS transporter [Candidatus Eremiobacterota bacterium]
MSSRPQEETLFGHPVGLYTLFFAEMWERFSFYGMRALLVLYMTKGFLKYGDEEAYGVYGAYGALVYATPFIGGLVADKILGARRAVVLGGSLMAAGHLLMGVQTMVAFYLALALLVLGNGFFKPNISTIVGGLYPQGSPRRDDGFTIFYMGINLGAGLAPLVCAYVGETYGWHKGFNLATLGMLTGLAVFVAPRAFTRVLIALGAVGVAVSLLFLQNNVYQLSVNVIMAIATLAAGFVASSAVAHGGIPDDAGQPPDPEAPTRKVLPGLRADHAVYAAVAVALPIVALLLRRNEWARILLSVFGGLAFLWLLIQAVKSPKVPRERLFVVLVMMFFSMLFWSFFEQAGSSLTNFTDRNVDRVLEGRRLTEADVGKTLELKMTQEQLGYSNGGQLITLTVLDKAREAKPPQDTVQWTVAPEHVGMGIGGAEMKASIFQSVNPIFILMFGPVFMAIWGILGRRGAEPGIPVKFALGLLQLGLGFAALYYGAKHADSRGMVALGWLILGYLLHTTGELCLSPVGLSMVTKLSPAKIVSTVMGAWFLATAFSHQLAAIIAGFTGVSHGEGEEKVIPPPIETVNVYGDVLGIVAIAAVVSSLICLALAPFLKKWMHTDLPHGVED